METILIVEDDAFFREIFSDILHAEGYQVDTASSGGKALEMMSQKNYTLVVTDMVLQDISGLDILSHAKQMDPGIEVIVVTGHGNMESAIFALKNGARDYLVKPISHDEFRHVVKLSMEQRRLLDENLELKEQIRLFQTCQTIANCIDIDRILALVIDAALKESGASTGFAALIELSGGRDFFESRGIPETEAKTVAEAIKPLCNWENITLIEPSLVKIVHGGTEREILLLPLGSNQPLHGIIAILDANQPTSPLPANRANLRFLIEQSSLALENAARFTVAKDLLNIDELTGLFNYRYLEIALEREIKRAERYDLSMSVIFLDVDMLKLVNDTHGHLVGSRVLKEVAAVIKNSVREVDIVIRYGGDEYTIILIETGKQGAAIVAERIRKTIETFPFTLGANLDVKLTASLGFACYPDDTRSKLELLEMADRAMYHGKSSGRNTVSHISESKNNPDNHP